MTSTAPPQTPTRRKHALSLSSVITFHPPDSSPPASPSPSPSPSAWRTRSRQSSASASASASVPWPTTPRTPHTARRPSSSQSQAGSITVHGELSGIGSAGLGGAGLGSLADELAEAGADGWGEEEEEEEEEEGGGGDVDDSTELSGLELPPKDGDRDPDSARLGQDDRSSPGRSQDGTSPTSARTHPARTGAPKTLLSDVEDAAEEDEKALDVDGDGIMPGLAARLAEVETLAQRGLCSLNGQEDESVARALDGLRELGGQGNVEHGTTRLITAHMALATHLTRQSRILHSLAYPLLAPFASAPSATTIEDLLPLLAHTSRLMPRPSASAPSSLGQLSGCTADLIQTLAQLADTLHMSRQTTTLAARRLKTARAVAADVVREAAVVQDAVRWIEEGNWPARLARRECAAVCVDVVAGFEDVCREWQADLARAALAAPAAGAAAAAAAGAGSSTTTTAATEVGVA
ncbi:MAG: hypothetical protein M1826_003664 [Phylliscum demangeonii]|nr:MAG: hypothetical protein M1826_003664 [Phylliscum demangeonii]